MYDKIHDKLKKKKKIMGFALQLASSLVKTELESAHN